MKFGIFAVFLFLFYLVRGQQSDTIGKSDCTKLYNFLNGDFEDYANDCCTGNNGIKCDNEGHITFFNNTNNNITDLKSFPYLPKIEELYFYNVDIKEIPDNIFELATLRILGFCHNNIEVIPPAIQNLTNLQLLRIIENGIKELPNELFNLKKLKVANLRTNHINTIPPSIQNSRIEELYLEENEIKELPDELFNLRSLTKLNLRANQIEAVPPAVQKLSKLEYFYLKGNNLKELPKEIFHLSSLKKITLHENPNLKTKVINFISSPLLECNLDNVGVLCYEQGTCKSITYNGREGIPDSEAKNMFNICTQKDVDEFLNQTGNNSSTLIIIGIIIGSIAIILICVLFAFMFIKKRKSKKHDTTDIISKDDFTSGNESIQVVLNGKERYGDNNNVGINNNNNGNNDNINNNNNGNNNNINNNNNGNNNNINNNNGNNNNSNNNNNVNSEINNNNNINNNNDNNFNDKKIDSISGDDIKKNLNQNNLYQNGMVNSNGHNSFIPGMVVLINDPQNPGSYIPFYNNNHTSIDMQSLLMNYNNNIIAMNADKRSSEILNSKSIDEKFDPPPEYTEN